MQDEVWMQEALIEAKSSGEAGEIPIGAVIVYNGEIIARAGNRTIIDCDPSAHAEMIVLREAAKKLNNYRLGDCALYVTVEPCVMCTGALIQSRISKLVFGAYNLHGGACGSDFDLARHPALNHHINEVKGGVSAEDAKKLMQTFFRAGKR